MTSVLDDIRGLGQMLNKAVRKRGNRRFINPYDKTCLAVTTWTVEVWTPYKKGRKHSIEANFSASDEAKGHYVCRKGDLRPIQNMITELTRFEAECISALDKAEELDAQSKK